MSQQGATAAERYLMPVDRIWLLLVVFTLFVGLIGYRVVSFQIFRSSELTQQAVASRMETNMVPAQRGDILDSDGLLLATNRPSAQVWAVLPRIDDPAALATQLAPLLDMDVTEINDRLTSPDLQWVLLANQIPADSVTAIEKLDIDGIVLKPEPARIYPSDSLAAQVLGFTNYDHEGNYGVEGELDAAIGGRAGKLVAERDGAGNIIALSPSTWDPPVDGADVQLTINSGVQRIIERVLRETVREQGATGGSIIVQNPETGAIIGMANWPSYNPNRFEQVDDMSVYSNPAISRVYEPGSTFKSIVMSIGIDDGAVTPGTVHNDAPGYIVVPGHAPITNNNGRVWGDETMTEVLENSTNLGAVFVAQQIGRDHFYKRLADFGIGKLTGIDLQGEVRGILTKPWQPDWNDTLFYTNPFGQGVAITPLQLTNAVSAIVNGGELMQPYVVAEERWPNGDVKRHQPEVKRRVISEESSATMREMLQSVIDNGTGVFAKVPGYNIGGKTGTAQIPSPDGGYLKDETIASMVGFGPVSDPRFTVLVKIDRPTESPWGETVAGPALKRIFQELFKLYGIPPSEAP